MAKLWRHGTCPWALATGLASTPTVTLVFEYTNTTEYSNIREYSDSPNPRGYRISVLANPVRPTISIWVIYARRMHSDGRGGSRLKIIKYKPMCANIYQM